MNFRLVFRMVSCCFQDICRDVEGGCQIAKCLRCVPGCCRVFVSFFFGWCLAVSRMFRVVWGMCFGCVCRVCEGVFSWCGLRSVCRVSAGVLSGQGVVK